MSTESFNVEKEYLVELVPDGKELTITVEDDEGNSEIVAWFDEEGELVIDPSALQRVGLTYHICD